MYFAPLCIALYWVAQKPAPLHWPLLVSTVFDIFHANVVAHISCWDLRNGGFITDLLLNLINFSLYCQNCEQGIATGVTVSRSVVYVSVCFPHPWGMQKRLNQLRCHLEAGLCSQKEPCIRWGLGGHIAPLGEYGGVIRSVQQQRCRLLLPLL